MKTYAVMVTLFIEAEDDVEADMRVDSFLGTPDYVLGWDLEEIAECPDESPSV